MSVTVSLEEQIRECFGRVVYSHKIHEKMADIIMAKLTLFKNVQIFLTSITSVGLVGIIITDELWMELATACIAVATTYLSTYLKNYDLGGLAQKHREAATKVWIIRESYFSLLADMATLQETDIRNKRNALQASLSEIYANAPKTNGKAYALAQEALKNNEELTFTPEEIDCFLPNSLKRSETR